MFLLFQTQALALTRPKSELVLSLQNDSSSTSVSGGVGGGKESYERQVIAQTLHDLSGLVASPQPVNFQTKMFVIVFVLARLFDFEYFCFPFSNHSRRRRQQRQPQLQRRP